MNGQSMWSDGCAVKASLQICNIRSNGVVDCDLCGWAYFIRDERAGSQVDPDVGSMPSPDFYDGPISGKIRADGTLLWNRRSVSEAAGALAAIAFSNHFYRFGGEERDFVYTNSTAQLSDPAIIQLAS